VQWRMVREKALCRPGAGSDSIPGANIECRSEAASNCSAEIPCRAENIPTVRLLE
jgi:hypothetical protein